MHIAFTKTVNSTSKASSSQNDLKLWGRLEKKTTGKPHKKKKHIFHLVVGFNPIEKLFVKIGSSPQKFGVKIN